MSKKSGVKQAFNASTVSNSIKLDLNNLLDFYAAKDKENEQKVKDFNESSALQQKADKANAEKLVTEAQVKADSIIANANLQAEESDKQRAAWLAEKQKIDSSYKFESQIKLDVGGTIYTTSLTTLRRFPDTMIGVMFSGRHALTLNADGAFFIDRDGLHFRHILNFLRMPEGFVLNLSEAHMAELTREAEYYGLRELMIPVFVPPADTTLVDSQYNQKFTISQDDKKLWYAKPDGNQVHRSRHVAQGSTKKLLTICSRCKTAGTTSFVPNFGQEFSVKFNNFTTGREISSAQPLYTFNNPCPSCGQY